MAGYPYPENGMSLRDYFAGQALGAIIRQCAIDVRFNGEVPEAYFSRKAYDVADAMLAERTKPETSHDD